MWLGLCFQWRRGATRQLVRDSGVGDFFLLVLGASLELRRGELCNGWLEATGLVAGGIVVFALGIVMATAVRWTALRPLQCASTVSPVTCKCQSFHGLWRKCCFVSRRRSAERGNRVGAFDDARSGPVMNGTAHSNEFGTLAVLFSNSQGDDGSLASRQELSLNLSSENDESNELYDKLKENAMTGESRTEGAEDEVESVEESGSEQSHVEAWKSQVETRIGTSYQHASQLLEAVNRTLDGLENGLVKHAENLEASALSEDFVFSGDVAEGLDHRGSEISSQSPEIEQMREEIEVRDNLLEMLRLEAIESSQTLKTATQAMILAKGKITYLQEQLDAASGFLQQEREATQRALDLFSSSLLALSDAEARIKELEKQVEIGIEGSQVEDNSAEVDSLKGLLDTKETIIQSMRDENRRNANMLVAAAETRKGLANAEKKVELFTAQVAVLEEEVRSRDMLLKEVRVEMVRSTDALKLASQIKQDLNASRQKELELTQDLEMERCLVKDLQQELAENHRAMRAEQTLRHMEKKLKDLQLEVEMLRGGVGARDEALILMREEVDRSVEVLANATESREAVRQLTSYVEDLRAELALKDETLLSLQEELSAAEALLRQKSLAPNSVPGAKTSTDPARPKPKSIVESPKVKRKPSVRKPGDSPRRPSPQS